MAEAFDRAVTESIDLAAAGKPWQALARLQEVDIEAALLRLTADEMRGNSRSERETAIAHAVTKLYEAWSDGQRVASVIGWLKVAAVRHARDFRRQRVGPDVPWDEPRHDHADTDEDSIDPTVSRARAVAIARTILPELGLPSVLDTMTTFLDRVAAGEDASPRALAEFLDMPYSTVTTHLSRGLKRLSERLSGRDLDALLDDEEDTDESMEEA